MRCIIEAKIPVEKGNTAIMEDKMIGITKDIIETLKPEAAYFYAKDGQRTMMMVADIEEADKIPKTIEPFWIDLNCDVQTYPAMSFEDLQNAKPDFENLIKKSKNRKLASNYR